jgi:hypothetical protein
MRDLPPPPRRPSLSPRGHENQQQKEPRIQKPKTQKTKKTKKRKNEKKNEKKRKKKQMQAHSTPAEEEVADEITKLMESSHNRPYIGEQISQLQHALQCAEFARDSGKQMRLGCRFFFGFFFQMCGNSFRPTTHLSVIAPIRGRR